MPGLFDPMRYCAQKKADYSAPVSRAAVLYIYTCSVAQVVARAMGVESHYGIYIPSFIVSTDFSGLFSPRGVAKATSCTVCLLCPAYRNTSHLNVYVF